MNDEDNFIGNSIYNFINNLQREHRPSIFGNIFTSFNNFVDEDIENLFEDDNYENFPKKIVSSKTFNKLRKVKFSGIIRCVETECPICFEKFNENDDIIILHCKHYFHIDCIKRWLTKEQNTCPVCREITKEI
jgi:hypothetical protein